MELKTHFLRRWKGGEGRVYGRLEDGRFIVARKASRFERNGLDDKENVIAVVSTEEEAVKLLKEYQEWLKGIKALRKTQWSRRHCLEYARYEDGYHIVASGSAYDQSGCDPKRLLAVCKTYKELFQWLEENDPRK